MRFMRLVIVESPYAPSLPRPTGGGCHGDCWAPPHRLECDFCVGLRLWLRELECNEAYARAAMRDCLLRGEAPYASHLLYTQPGVLDDTVPEQRALGIRAGFEWRRVAEATVVYIDLGISAAMQQGIFDATALGRQIEYRTLDGWEAKAA